MQEARSKFNVETLPDNAIIFEPMDGNLSEGSAMLHFERFIPSAFLGRINCKACFFPLLIYFSEYL